MIGKVVISTGALVAAAIFGYMGLSSKDIEVSLEKVKVYTAQELKKKIQEIDVGEEIYVRLEGKVESITIDEKGTRGECVSCEDWRVVMYQCDTVRVQQKPNRAGTTPNLFNSADHEEVSLTVVQTETVIKHHTEAYPFYICDVDENGAIMNNAKILVDPKGANKIRYDGLNVTTPSAAKVKSALLERGTYSTVRHADHSNSIITFQDRRSFIGVGGDVTVFGYAHKTEDEGVSIQSVPGDISEDNLGLRIISHLNQSLEDTIENDNQSGFYFGLSALCIIGTLSGLGSVVLTLMSNLKFNQHNRIK